MHSRRFFGPWLILFQTETELQFGLHILWELVEEGNVTGRVQDLFGLLLRIRYAGHDRVCLLPILLDTFADPLLVQVNARTEVIRNALTAGIDPAGRLSAVRASLQEFAGLETPCASDKEARAGS